MVKTEKEDDFEDPKCSEEASTSKSKQKNQGKKRKRSSSESSNDNEFILADNALETERNVHVSALKNNLDETSVRKIIKRVVTNDHVLALVKLQEEEEDSGPDDKNLQPKLTRAKVKELKKVSTSKSSAWDLEKLELTPIKHIPVKTRPEVKALIAQELPDDEDDEEYEPTNDDLPSDDDHVESSSDLDSQPRTPATPAPVESPRLVKDGPFKVPQDVSTARRKLEIEDEVATIALRTRSKLSLSATSIEHIESTFVPPDDLPIQDVDDLWNEFLNECLNPASAAKHEDDDEADPEYNVAADADAHDEDEEALSNSIIKISKKELNDLVTELFSILPGNEENIAELPSTAIPSTPIPDTTRTNVPQWEGKQEPLSDDEGGELPSMKLKFEKELSDEKEQQDAKNKSGKEMNVRTEKSVPVQKKKVASPKAKAVKSSGPRLTISTKNKNIEISIEENPRNAPAANSMDEAPPSLRNRIKTTPQTVHIQVESNVMMTPEQLQILQQQLRQHIQLTTTNFMQTVVHPVHWKLAPTYKEYLVSLTKFAENKEESVVNVCNLKPALELVNTWEKSVTEDTEENRKMIEFLQSEVEKSRRRLNNNSLYGGQFHETFKEVIANSPVFLYPYLLPSMPFRPDVTRRFCYLHSEDTLIVLGLDQFWPYVENNPKLYKLQNCAQRARPGFMATVELVSKHMFPWTTANRLAGRINAVRSGTDKDNPIYRYFKHNEVPVIPHTLLPFNPALTLYEQPEHEVPRLWVRYLAKTSKRFRAYLHKRSSLATRQPAGVQIHPGVTTETTKKPLPIDFTKQIISHRASLNEKPPEPAIADKFDVNIQTVDNNQTTPQNPPVVAKVFYHLVETSVGAYLVPLQVATQSVTSNTGPIATPAEITSGQNNSLSGLATPVISSVTNNGLPEKTPEVILNVVTNTCLANTTPVPLSVANNTMPEKAQATTSSVTNNSLPNTVTYSKEHCMCCVILRKICKKRQSLITEYFSKSVVKECECNRKRYPKISNRLKLLVKNHKKRSEVVFKELERRLQGGEKPASEAEGLDSKDIAYVLSYQLKVFTQASMSKRIRVKKRISNLLSSFDLNSGDPIKLAADLFKAYDVELMDLYLDFLGFLTPEQADEMGVWKDYFTRNCAKDLMEKIEEQVPDREARESILTQLKSTFTRGASACEQCAALLSTMSARPALATYCFNMFPHRRETRAPMYKTMAPAVISAPPNVANDVTCDGPSITVDYEADHSSRAPMYKTVAPAVISAPPNDANDVTCDGPSITVDYEADHSSSGEESDAMSVDLEPPAPEPPAPPEPSQETAVAIKTEPPAEEPVNSIAISIETYDSDMSSFDEDNLKIEEATDWTRVEDRLILQVLQEHLTREERKDSFDNNKSIIELLEEKHVYEMLFESLTDRSVNQIKERVLYLLTMLVISERDT